MRALPRITLDPEIMGGKPTIRGMQVTVGTIVELVGAGYSAGQILEEYPYLEAEDIRQALAYTAWQLELLDIDATFERHLSDFIQQYRPALEALSE